METQIRIPLTVHCDPMIPPDFNFNLPEQDPHSVPEKAPDPEAPEAAGPTHFIKKFHDFVEGKFGPDHRITAWIKKIKIPSSQENVLDSLSQLKQERSHEDALGLALAMGLIIVLFLIWKNGPVLLHDIDQYKNDVQEQKQVIKMEEQNNDFLQRLDSDRNTLGKNLNQVYSAVAGGDERAEEVIAMLEDAARKNRMIIESISIREVSENQFYYDDLQGIVQPYEYAFSVEGPLPNIFSFIGSLRSSLRLMDILSFEMEEGKGTFKASFSIYAYDLVAKDKINP